MVCKMNLINWKRRCFLSSKLLILMSIPPSRALANATIGSQHNPSQKRSNRYLIIFFHEQPRKASDLFFKSRNHGRSSFYLLLRRNNEWIVALLPSILFLCHTTNDTFDRLCCCVPFAKIRLEFHVKLCIVSTFAGQRHNLQHVSRTRRLRGDTSGNLVPILRPKDMSLPRVSNFCCWPTPVCPSPTRSATDIQVLSSK